MVSWVLFVGFSVFLLVIKIFVGYIWFSFGDKYIYWFFGDKDTYLVYNKILNGDNDVCW